jgi:hypothetical protein
MYSKPCEFVSNAMLSPQRRYQESANTFVIICLFPKLVRDCENLPLDFSVCSSVFRSRPRKTPFLKHVHERAP